MTSATQFANAQILQLNPDDIQIDDRIGLYWPEKAEALGRLIAKDGQNDPIKVRANGSRAKRKWTLVAGLHRLEGVRLMSLTSVSAIEVIGDADDYRMVEASENIHRRDFGPIEKALFVRALADIYQRQVEHLHVGLSQQQIAIKKRWDDTRNSVAVRESDLIEIEADHTAATIAAVYGWTDELREATGWSERKLRDYLRIHRTIIAPFERSMWEALAHHSLGHKLKSIMQIAEYGEAIGAQADRRRLIAWIIEHPDAKSVDEAKVALGLSGSKSSSVKPDTQTGFIDRAETNLSRLSPSSWRSFAPSLAAQVKKSALLHVRDALNARIAAEGGEEALATGASS